LSFKQYLNRKRIEAAKELLAQREYNITEVGYAVGFNDASYFSRVFREVEGCSPRDHLISKDYFA
jgi:two-component system response regulator YesN